MPPYKATTILRQEFPRGEAHSMDAVAFDEAIRSQGVTLVHYRAMACPSGLVNKDDTNRRFHEDHPGCSNGYLYKKIGTITALFVGNGADPSSQDFGVIDGSTVSVTFPRNYDDSGETVYVSPFDRFYLAEESILWPNWEIIEHNISGRDKLRFPAVRVENLIDNRLVEYKQGIDFDVSNGQIVWRQDGTRPGVDPEADSRGRVCTAWYLFKPYWYCQRLGHEARIIQTEDENGERQVTRMPFQATLVREHIFESQQKNDELTSESDQREARAPRDGSFAPR